MDDRKNVKQSSSLGFFVGFFFSIVGLFAGFLYPTDSEQREKFIDGWKDGAKLSLVICLIIFVIGLATIR